jgi:hypothetical protein
MRYISYLCLFVLLLAGLPQAGAADFSGDWTLNTSKGQNLGMVAAIQESLVVAQSDSALKIDFTDVFQGNTTTRQTEYDLSGAAVQNFAAMGDASQTVSRWEGDTLITTWTSEGAIVGTEVVKIETRKLIEDGQSMSVETAREGRPSMILVYDRPE